MFIDKVKIKAVGGNGGNGCISFRREKYVPRGGPDGGDGGNGGNVILQADADIDSLVALKFAPLLRAERGKHGKGKQKTGHRGADRITKVPVGTLIKLPITGDIIFDLDQPGLTYVLADGGKGGRGNFHFRTSKNRTPEIAEPGADGEEIELELELKLIADVGLVGYPNAGKSALLSKICDSRPKIAGYPFTTLSPNLGVLKEIAEYRIIKIADVPGLIEGAHENRGLGHQFLRHIERTRMLLFVIDTAGQDGRDPLEDFQVLKHELELHNPELARKPFIVACNKMDIEASAEKFEQFHSKSGVEEQRIFTISCKESSGLSELSEAIVKRLDEESTNEENRNIRRDI